MMGGHPQNLCFKAKILLKKHIIHLTYSIIVIQKTITHIKIVDKKLKRLDAKVKKHKIDFSNPYSVFF